MSTFGQNCVPVPKKAGGEQDFQKNSKIPRLGV